MAQVIYGNNAVFQQLDSMRNPYANDINDWMSRASNAYNNMFGGFENAITNAVTNVNNFIQNSGAYQRAVNIARSFQSNFLPNAICRLNETWQVQHAPEPMIRGIMANPTVQKLYWQGAIQGYGDRYTNIYQTQPEPTEHRDYMLVNNGLVLESEEYDYEIVNYSDDLYAYDDDYYDPLENLTMEQQEDIKHAWILSDAMIGMGYDPTDEFNGKLP